MPVMSPSLARRALTWTLVVLAGYCAVQGGEYSTTDLLRQRTRRAMLQRSIDSLQREVDSLAALRKRVLSDPALQERIARENYGMVRGEKELLYRFVEVDSGKQD